MEQSEIKELAGKPQSIFMEHRWGQRMPCQARVRLSAGAGIKGAGRVRNISSSGAFIETALDLPVYSRVALVVLGNESATRVVEIAASVVRVERDGIGVEWCDTPSDSICAVVGCTTRCAVSTTPRCTVTDQVGSRAQSALDPSLVADGAGEVPQFARQGVQHLVE